MSPIPIGFEYVSTYVGDIARYNIVSLQESVLEKYGINKVRFDTIFAGTLPDFTVRVKRSVKHKQESIDKFLTSTVSKQKTLEKVDPLKKVSDSGKVNDTGAAKKFRKPR